MLDCRGTICQTQWWTMRMSGCHRLNIPEDYCGILHSKIGLFDLMWRIYVKKHAYLQGSPVRKAWTETPCYQQELWEMLQYKYNSYAIKFGYKRIAGTFVRWSKVKTALYLISSLHVANTCVFLFSGSLQFHALVYAL